MAASPLEHPADIYRPFSRAETTTLRGFVEDLRRLAAMRFFSQVPKSASMSWQDGQGLVAQMDEPDDEATRAAITVFRQLYSHGEPGSMNTVFRLLKQSVHEHGGPLRDDALAELDGHLEAARLAVKTGIGVGIVFEQGDESKKITPRDIIDAYFHGHYLHGRNDKADLAKRLDELQPWPKYTLYTVMLTLRNVYWNAANAVDRVLAEPALLDSADVRDSGGGEQDDRATAAEGV